MSVVSNNILAGASGQGGGGYEIERSVRFNSADTPKITRTPSSAGNQKTWTLSFWMKRTTTGSREQILSAAGTHNTYVEFQNDKLMIEDHNPGLNFILKTTRVFRDHSSWYSVIVSVDTTQATASNRIKLYINGVQETAFDSATYPSQNYDTSFNDTGEHKFGQFPGNTSFPFNGYLADVHFIDGQALAPTDFGETDDNGVWQPKKFAGSYNYAGTSGSTNYTNISTLAALSGSSIDSSYNAVSKVFDGSGTGVRTVAEASNQGEKLSITFSPAITLSNETVSIDTSSTYQGMFVTVDGSDGSRVSGSDSNTSTLTTGSLSGSLSKITVDNGTDSSGRPASILRIRIGGSVLLDPGTGAGVNGFHLDFKDNSSNAALGTDTSGNSNTWTVNNLVATGGALISKVSGGNTATSDSATSLFNGTTSGTYIHPSAGNDVVFTNFAISNARIYSFNGNYQSNYANGKVYTNSTTTPVLTLSHDNQFQWYSLPADATLLYRLEGAIGAGNQAFGTHAIESGGVILSDSPAADIDSLVDTPSQIADQTDTGAGGEVVGNYATLNPLHASSPLTLANGNLYASNNAESYKSAVATIGVNTGKWYWEVTCTSVGFVTSIGIGNDMSLGGLGGSGNISYHYDGTKYISGANSSYGASYSSGDILGFALDMDSGTLECFKNNASQGNIATGLTGIYFPRLTLYGTHNVTYNFGQRAFAYTAPSGYKSLNTANLPEPTIADGSKYFDTKLYTGNGGTQSITTEFSPDFVWFKARSDAYSHSLFDIVRGVQKRIKSNSADAEATDSTALTAFNSDGFTVSGSSSTNLNNDTYVAWAWDAGDSNTTIAAGGLNSSVYNQSQTWSSSLTASSGLSGATNAFDGSVSTRAQSSAGTNQTLTFAPSSGVSFTSILEVYCDQGDATPTASWNGNSVNPGGGAWVTVATGSGTINASYPLVINTQGASQYATLKGVRLDGKILVDSGVSVTNVPSIASTVRANPSAGFSIVKYNAVSGGGSVGHGLSSDPQWIIVKRLDAAENWCVYSYANGNDAALFLNTTASRDAHSSYWNDTDPNSSVFTLGSSGNVSHPGDDYIAYCFAPVAGYSAMGSYTGNGSADGSFVYTGFRPKFLIIKNVSQANSWFILDTEVNTYNVADNYLLAEQSAAEATFAWLDILSNGFKLRSTATGNNNSGIQNLYIAFAENPFKTARAR